MLPGPEGSAKSNCFKSGPMGIRESRQDNEEEEVCRLEQTLQGSGSLLDNALGSPHFKTESWTNIKGGSECKNHLGLGL